jgi:hypothetical protein
MEVPVQNFPDDRRFVLLVGATGSILHFRGGFATSLASIGSAL